MTSSPSRRSRPVRVLRIIARLNIGGPAIHVSLLTAGMNDREFHSVLVTGRVGPGEGDMAYLAREKGIEPIIVGDLGREISPWSDFKTLIALIRLICREQPDIVHTHTAKAGLVGRLAAWLCRVPVIIHTFHGHAFEGYFNPIVTRTFVWLERLCGLFTTAILTVSSQLQEDLIQYKIAPRAKIRVMPLGLDLAPLAAVRRGPGEFRRELGVESGTPLIGIVGRLVPIKNHDLFLSAAAQVAQALPNAYFVVVGDGERRAELELAASTLGLARQIAFTGWRRDLPALYADLDLVVLTSRNEGTPVSLIEAMAAGVPVVATSVGGVPDLLAHGEFGALVPSEDSEALSAAIVTALTQPDPQRANRARQWILSTYGVERLIADIKHLYNELLDA